MFSTIKPDKKDNTDNPEQGTGSHSSDSSDDKEKKKKDENDTPKIPDFFVVESLRFSLSEGTGKAAKKGKKRDGYDLEEKEDIPQNKCICEIQFDRENKKMRLHVGIAYTGGDSVMDSYSADYPEASGENLDFYVPLTASICNEIISWVGLAQGLMQDNTQNKQEKKT